MSLKSATELMSIITIVCGISGTLAGSLITDQRMGKYVKDHEKGLITQVKLQYISVEKSSLSLFIIVCFATAFALAGRVDIDFETEPIGVVNG